MVATAPSDEELAADVFGTLSTRMVGDGVPYPDVLELKQRIGRWSEWFREWHSLAEERETRAREALAGGYRVTAGELFFEASILWHYAQFLWFHRREERELGQRRKVQAYRSAAGLLTPPAERVEIDFEGTTIPAYLRRPAHSAPPCVVLIGGLESTKEEGRLFEELCLRRGIATFAFDGPGQGEYFFERPMVADFERYCSRAVDYLVERDDIDASRLAVLGRSLGGHYAVRSAAFDDRFIAAVDWGGPYDLSFFDEMELLTQRGFRYVTGERDEGNAEREARRMISLEGVPERITVPLYVQHGELDTLIPVADARRLVRETSRASITLAIDPEGTHCGHNIYHRVRPRMADWLARQLDASGYGPSSNRTGGSA